MKKSFLTVAIMLMIGSISNKSYAQCPVGQVEVSFDIITDTYAEEGYWQLVPNGNACGAGTILSGGNTTQLNCSSGGTPVTSTGGNGYANNATINVPFTCLTQGAQYDIKYIDDYGDGGFIFKVKVNGYVVKVFHGTGASQTFTFTASEPPNYDLSSSQKDNTTFLQRNFITNTESLNLKAKLFNWGKQTINSLRFNYQVNGGSVVNSTITGLTLSNFTDTVLQCSMPFASATNGNFNIKMWMDNLNGSNLDSLNANDTTLKIVTVGNGIPNLMSNYIGYWVSDSVVVNSSNQVSTPVDIDFHPNLSRKEMWVVNKNTEATGGTTVIVSNTGTASQTSQYMEDANNWHFMSLPTAIAFSDNENFANSPGVFDANHNGGTPFTGPALWTSDLTIYGGPASNNGDHLDMLHESPYSQGIAWEKENAFWNFDGYNNDIVRYDFAGDHDPGNDDHSDGIIHRYADFAVARDANDVVPSHLVLDKNRKWLYLVDHGNKRVMRIDITTGTIGGTPTFGPHETVHEYKMVTGYDYDTVVSTGLNKPCGIEIIDNTLIVSDYATNELIFYNVTSMPATELYRVAIPNSNGIMGIKIGPDGYIYAVDNGNNRVVKVKPTTPNAVENISDDTKYSVYPNPSKNKWYIVSQKNMITSFTLTNQIGEVVEKGDVNALSFEIENVTLANGIYYLTVLSNGKTITSKLNKQ